MYLLLNWYVLELPMPNRVLQSIRTDQLALGPIMVLMCQFSFHFKVILDKVFGNLIIVVRWYTLVLLWDTLVVVGAVLGSRYIVLLQEIGMLRRRLHRNPIIDLTIQTVLTVVELIHILVRWRLFHPRWHFHIGSICRRRSDHFLLGPHGHISRTSVTHWISDVYQFILLLHELVDLFYLLLFLLYFA